MIKTQVYLPAEELKALRRTARRSGRSLAALVRDAIRIVWAPSSSGGPVGLWSGKIKRTSIEHDHIYDQP